MQPPKGPSLLTAKLGLLANFLFQAWELQNLGKKCTPVDVDLVAIGNYQALSQIEH
jgi:hypothetical protein